MTLLPTDLIMMCAKTQLSAQAKKNGCLFSSYSSATVMQCQSDKEDSCILLRGENKRKKVVDHRGEENDKKGEKNQI